MRSVTAIAVLVLTAVAAPAGAPDEAQPKGYDEFRAAWRAFADPVKKAPKAPIPLEVRQDARIAALPHMQAAVAADPRNPSYHAALAYIQMEAAKYREAKKSIDKAIDLERRDPLLYLLRGQAEAALGNLEPDKAADKSETALRAFEEAARLDRGSSLPLLQSASVALDAGRADLAAAAVERALKRFRFVLRPLPLPEPFDPRPDVSTRMWQYVQLGQWQQLVARCTNVQRAWLKLGGEKEAAGEVDAAYGIYQQALEIGRRVGAAEPNIFITVNYGIQMMYKAYAELARVAEATGSSELGRWRGETGVLDIGQQDLYGAFKRYEKRLKENPPASVDALLALEAKLVRQTILGIGLMPAPAPKD